MGFGDFALSKYRDYRLRKLVGTWELSALLMLIAKKDIEFQCLKISRMQHNQLLHKLWKCLQMSTGVYRCLQMSSNVCGCLQMSADVYRCLQMSTDVCRCLQMFALFPRDRKSERSSMYNVWTCLCSECVCRCSM